jgi:hypothetical protein
MDIDSIVTRFLEAAGIKKSNMPHGSILPINYVLTSKDITTSPDELDYASCIGSLIYLSYTRPDISVTVNKLVTYSRQSEKNTSMPLSILCATSSSTHI